MTLDRAGFHRDRFPALEHAVYLDVAAVGITATDVGVAISQVATDHEQLGVHANTARAETITHVRERLAALVGGDPSRVAFTQNTSTGLALVCNGMPWRDGDNVLVPAGEFPSNFYPWTQLTRHGVEVREVVPMIDGHVELEAIRALCDHRTRLLAISAVQYSSGFRYDLAALGALSAQAGILLVVDGTQAAGGLVVETDSVGVDVLAVSAHKWMLGPLGIGFVHLSERAMELLHPSVTGWLSVADPFAFDHLPRFADDARRFESGTENVSGIAGLGAALDLALATGPTRIEEHILGSADDLSLLLEKEGWHSLRPRDPDRRSGILIATSGADDRPVFEHLREQGVACSLRGGGIRFAPHYYTSSGDLERVIQLIQDRR